MGQIYGPDVIPLPVRASNSTLSLATTYNSRPARVTIGGQQFPITTALALSTATTGAGALDTGAVSASATYNVYLIAQSGGTVAMIASLAAPSVGPLIPNGYLSHYKFIGAFNTVNSNITHVAGLDVSGGWPNQGAISSDTLSLSVQKIDGFSYSASGIGFTWDFYRIGRLVHGQVVFSGTTSSSPGALAFAFQNTSTPGPGWENFWPGNDIVGGLSFPMSYVFNGVAEIGQFSITGAINNNRFDFVRAGGAAWTTGNVVRSGGVYGGANPEKLNFTWLSHF